MSAMVQSLTDLRREVAGRVIEPADAEYDGARSLFYGGMDRRPAAIVRVTSPADVAATIAFARRTGIELSVRSGGHSVSGLSVVDDGVVIDLSELRSMELDAEGRTAWAGAGLAAGEYTIQAAAHGLATGFGDSPSVGVAGITLGGGVGFLSRRDGLTIDSLLGAELVTADGEVLRVDADSQPDLFWAIRGGGGNFGIVTRLGFRLHELGAVVGGILMLPATPETIVAFVEAADEAPEQLTAIANVMPAPPMPIVPEEHHGRPMIFGLVVHAGDGDAGVRAADRLRGIAEPFVDQLRPMTYPEIYLPEEEGYHPIAAARTGFLDDFDRGTAETILDRIATSTAMMAVAQVRVLGGAVARVPNDATAYAHRDRRIMVNTACLFQDPDERPIHDEWAAELAATLGSDRGAYVNFLGSEGEERVRQAYPGPTWDRLREIKRRFDPTNLFRSNQNIPPADEPGRPEV
jgi:FAD/FMN-containing dehydrogenase